MTAGPDRMPAPELPGYTFRSVLGRGGFADVFRYEQDRARRDVAIKVLRTRVDGRDRATITAEAEAMAQLSTHPYIVTIHDTDVAPDGRPYLVMEYYSRPNLARRARGGGFDVPETLRVGVQVASAVETAHRAGIVHRDIKPANILTSDYGRPGLTDFGIASRAGVTTADDGALSVPWAAPELFREGVVPDQRADIYALGATLWTLLVGRSPFEAPGGDNSELVLWYRIEQNPVPPTGRPDAPACLERVLRQALAKRPEQRFSTALEFARELQSVQGELRLAVEPVALPDLGLTTSRPRPRDGPEHPGAGPAPTDQESVVTLLRSPRRARSRAAPPPEQDPYRPPDGGARPASRGPRARTSAVRVARVPVRPAGRPPVVPARPDPPGAAPADAPASVIPPLFPSTAGPGPGLGGRPRRDGPTGPDGRAGRRYRAELGDPTGPGTVPGPSPGAGSRAGGGSRRRRRAPAAVPRPGPGAGARRLLPATVAAAVVVLGATGLAVTLARYPTGSDDGGTGPAGPTGGAGPDPVITGAPTGVEILDQDSRAPVLGATRLGSTSVRFSWTVPEAGEVAGYLVTRLDGGRGARPWRQPVSRTSFDLTGLAPEDLPCLEVSSTDRNGHAGPARRICAP